MRKVVFGGIFLVLMALQLQAGDRVAIKSDHPDRYIVKKGDTLWDISEMFLEDPWLWPEIWHVNPQINNPHLIYPGDELRLVYIDGRPRLTATRNGAVHLSPKVRVSDLEQAIPAISLEVINPFLSRNRVLGADDLEGSAYVLAGFDGRIIAGAGDVFYSRGPLEESKKAYGIYRSDGAFTDPDTGEVLGYSARDIGSATLQELDGEVGTFALNRSVEEVRRGDRLLPEEERNIDAYFYPSAPDGDVEGYIIAVDGGVSQVGAMDVVVINKGTVDGLATGNLLAIYRRGEVVRDTMNDDLVKIPDTRSGLLMVFRTYERVSYGLVVKASRPLSVMDKVRNP